MMVAKTFSNKLTIFLGAMFFLSLLTGCASADQQDITGVTWQWISLEETSPASISLVPNPENFTLTFDKESGLGLKLDCNVGNGSYDAGDGSMNIELGMTTLAFCGEDSLDVLFTELLGQVDSYLLEDGNLVLLYGDGMGKMIFSR